MRRTTRRVESSVGVLRAPLLSPSLARSLALTAVARASRPRGFLSQPTPCTPLPLYRRPSSVTTAPSRPPPSAADRALRSATGVPAPARTNLTLPTPLTRPTLRAGVPYLPARLQGGGRLRAAMGQGRREQPARAVGREEKEGGRGGAHEAGLERPCFRLSAPASRLRWATCDASVAGPLAASCQRGAARNPLFGGAGAAWDLARPQTPIECAYGCAENEPHKYVAGSRAWAASMIVEVTEGRTRTI